MSLQDLEKDLQRHDPVMVQRDHPHTVYDVWKTEGDSAEESKATQVGGWQKIKDRMQEPRVKAIVYAGMGLMLLTIILGVVLAFFYFQKGFFNEDRVVLMMEAAPNINSNKLTEIIFHYENDNRAQLDNAEIVVNFGKYFVPEDNQDHFMRAGDGQGVFTIGTIPGHGAASVTLVGHFAGPQGAVDDVTGTLRYVPERTSARFEKRAKATTMITSSSVRIDIQAPLEVVSGNLMDIGFVVQNTSGEELRNINLSVEVPKSFSFYSASPSPNHGTVWLINSIPAHDEVVVRMRGGLNAEVGTVQTFAVFARSKDDSGKSVEYAQNTYTPRMTRSPIIIQQKVDDADNVIYAGEQLMYHISFKNDSAISLRNAIVVMKLDGSILDLAKLNLIDKGDYDQENKTITWKASDVPLLKTLAPGDSGEVRFSVPLLEQLPVQGDKDFHYSVSTIASIDSADIPSELRENKTVLSNVLSIPVGAKVIVTPKLVHKDGVLPLTVGQKTVFTMTFSVGSVNNDLLDVVVTIPLPTHVKYEGSDIDGITFNDRANELVWNVGAVKHGSGIVQDAVTMSYDFSVTPSVDQIKITPVIMNSYSVKGVDAFVQKDFAFSFDSMTAASGSIDQANGTVKE